MNEVAIRKFERLLQATTPADIRALQAFSRFRLMRCGLNPDEAEDVAQTAFLVVLQGAGDLSKGRHPRSRDVENGQVFRSYLKGVINSLIEARRRRSGHWLDYWPGGTDRADLPQPARDDLAATDLAKAFFWGLRVCVPRRLEQLVSNWEANWQEYDSIPLCGHHRRYRQELRRFAFGVWKTL